MSKLRIAHVTAVFPPYWAGTGNVAYYNALELARRGHEVHVFTAQYPLNGYADPKEFTVHRLWTPFRIGNAPLTPTLVTTLRSFDLVHLHWPFIFGAELTWLAIKSSRTPLVMTYHIDLRGDRKWIFGPYQKFWGPILARSSRKVIAVSLDHLKSSQIIQSINHRDTDIIEVPNGVDINLFTPNISGREVRDQYGIPEDAYVILFVGAMDKAHEYKGVPDLLNAFIQLNNSHVWLLLIGGGNFLPTYKELVKKQMIHYSNHVIFTGSIAYNCLPKYYSAADIFVLPSRQTESFGMVIIEAMACGKPVLASDLPGVRSVIIDGVDGLLFQPRDVIDLREKIKRLISNSELRIGMGRKGQSKVEKCYAWPNLGERLEKVYYSVMTNESYGVNL